MPDPLYFIALVPPEPLKSRVKKIKQFVSDTFNSSRALNSPAHITLVPPFRLNEHNLRHLDHLLESAVQSISTFSVKIEGYDCFKPRVIFLNILRNE